MLPTDDYMDRMCAFFATQDYLVPIDIGALRAARKREDLGITSLSVIILVVNYMEAKGVSVSDFEPAWIERLESVEGIASVLREIDGVGPSEH